MSKPNSHDELYSNPPVVGHAWKRAKLNGKPLDASGLGQMKFISNTHQQASPFTDRLYFGDSKEVVGNSSHELGEKSLVVEEKKAPGKLYCPDEKYFDPVTVQ